MALMKQLNKEENLMKDAMTIKYKRLQGMDLPAEAWEIIDGLINDSHMLGIVQDKKFNIQTHDLLSKKGD